MRAPSVLICILCVATSAAADGEAWIFRVRGIVTPASPEVEIDLRVRIGPGDIRFAGARLDVVADEPLLREPELVLRGPGAVPGTVSAAGDTVEGIVLGRLNFPCGILGCPDEELVWRVRFTTTDFAPRQVGIVTVTSVFEVYPVEYSPISESRLDTLTEAKAIIRIARCAADCDTSGELDLFDFLCFQNAFAQGDWYADCDGSQLLDLFDFLCFQNEFASGCP
ncbi:MAG: hypothetical protein ACF8R7_12055 [Phycisphaerales bacterium JB039]